MYIRHVIDQAMLLGEMPEAVRAALAAAATVRRYRNGEFVWHERDPAEGLHVVAEGIVHIGNFGPDGEEVLLHVVPRGECMGEPGIYSPERDRRTHARAVGRTTIVSIGSEAVRTALEASPPAMLVFVRRVSEICRSHLRRVTLTSFHDARGRLARLLLDLAASHGVPTPRGRRIDLALSQRTLAGLVSVRREHVNRLISELQSERALSVEDGIVTVLDERALRSALGIEADDP